MSIEEFARILWAWVDDLATCDGCPLRDDDRDDCAKGDCPLERACDDLGLS